MTVFCDSSIITKRYYDEPGSDWVRHVRPTLTRVVVAEVTWAEVYSALNRKVREGNLSRADYLAAAGQFAQDWAMFDVVPFTPALMTAIRGVSERHALRAGDAQQLASALLTSPRAAVRFWTADQRLADAARAEGLVLF